MFNNPILWTDGYKYSHWNQYPERTEGIFSYWMPRTGGLLDGTPVVPFGMQYLLKQYLSKQITHAHVDEAKAIVGAYFSDDTVFNEEGFRRIVDVHNGYWPVVIRFAPEGLPIPTGNVLMTMQSTDDQLPWVPQFLETLCSQLWYATTVCSLSRKAKDIIFGARQRTGTPEGTVFALHDFGFRGVSSVESSGIGGAAHLVNFRGTDTMTALQVARDVYGEPFPGVSIPAAEHSTVTIYGQGHEYEAFKNMIEQFGEGGSGLYAVVSDSEDIYHACDVIWGQQLKSRVLAAKNTLVIRPDSGDPLEVVPRLLEILGSRFGSYVNSKGYKVLNDKVRLIWGDGIDVEMIRDILGVMEFSGWSADNIAFGMGGGLLQKVNRDDFRFAMKASSAVIDGKVVDFAKNPVGQGWKSSIKGRIKLIRDGDTYRTVPCSDIGENVLQVVYDNGWMPLRETFAEIRNRAKLPEE